GSRTDHLTAIVLQCLQIILNNGILEHLGVHSRRKDYFAAAGHHCGGQHVIGNAMGDLPDYIGRSRSHHNHICFFCQCHMFHIVLNVPVESIDQALISRQSLKSNGINEVLCVFCHQHMYVCMKLFQGAGKGSDLVCGNASCHCQHNCFTFQHNFTPFPFFVNCPFGACSVSVPL